MPRWMPGRSSILPSVRLAAATSAPSAAKAIAMARPMPCPAPVTSARLPASRPAMLCFLSSRPLLSKAISVYCVHYTFLVFQGNAVLDNRNGSGRRSEQMFTMEAFSLQNRRALIIGGSGGIGLALARGLAAAGAQVLVAGRDAAKLQRAAEAL